MPSPELFVFAGLVVVFAMMSVAVRSVVSAVFCQFQAVLAVAGLLSGLDARFVGFSLVIMSAATFLVFLMFALIVFDFYDVKTAVPPRTAKLCGWMSAAAALETGWVFLSHPVKADGSPALLPFEDLFYKNYGFCPVLFGVLLLACMVGIASVLTEEGKSRDR